MDGWINIIINQRKNNKKEQDSTLAPSARGPRQNFNVGDGLKIALPNVFWTRLQSTLGNTFYVKDNGEDAAITRAVDAIDECARAGFCVDVPKALDATTATLAGPPVLR